MADRICQACNLTFDSRNKLFKHLKFCGKEFSGEFQRPNLQETAINVSIGFLYVFGGRFRGKTLGTVERYCLHNKKWETSPSLLENRGSHGAATIENKIYVCGGGGFDSNLATCEVFDIDSQTWSLISPMTTYRHALAVVALKADYLVFKEVRASDLMSCIGSQTLITPDEVESPLKKVCTSTAVIQPKIGDSDSVSVTESGTASDIISSWGICAVGGWINGSICSGHLEIFNPITNTWHMAAPMSHPRRLLGAADYDGRLFVFGGNCDDGIWYTAAVEVYNPISNSWSQLHDLPHAGPTSAISFADKIFVFLHGKRVFSYDPKSDTYSPLSSLPLAEWYSFDVTRIGNKIYVHGGASKGVWSKALYSYDTTLDLWERLSDMSTCRRRCAAAAVAI